jgi:hypothetical protein
MVENHPLANKRLDAPSTILSRTLSAVGGADLATHRSKLVDSYALFYTGGYVLIFQVQVNLFLWLTT